MQNKLVWIDCEMTGLNVSSDQIIEIAVLITDSYLKLLDEGLNIVIRIDEEKISSMVDVVKQMHTQSLLIEEIRQSNIDIITAENVILDYILSHIKNNNSALLAGNSISTDRKFIARDMIRLDNYLHYRMIDVSSVKELCRRWFPKFYLKKPEKNFTHRALADIYESVKELRYYKSALVIT